MKKLLVKKILEEANSYKWSLQGFGMLRLYLSDEVRLHVWDSSYAREDVSTIHNHPWDFVSRVIAGLVRNQRLTEHKKYSGLDAAPYKKALILCGPNGGMRGGTETVGLTPGEVESFSEGAEYLQLASEIHRSMPEDGTVTLVERRFRDDRDHAHVYWRSDEEWVSAEPRTALPQEVHNITQNALRLWF